MKFYAFLITLMQLVLSSFWTWLGFIILVDVIGGALVELVKAIKRNRRITGYRVGQRWHIQIENATSADVRRAIKSAAYEPEEGWEKAMSRNGKRETEHSPVDRFKINNREIEPYILKALTAAGFGVDIAPGIALVGPLGDPVPHGSIITVYRKEQKDG